MTGRWTVPALVCVCVCVYTSALPPKLIGLCHKLSCFDRLTKNLHNFTRISHLVLCEMWYWHDRLSNCVALLEMKYLHLVWCKKSLHAARVFQMITSLMARKSESYWFGFIPVKYLCVHTCVLAVIMYRKIDKKQRVNKVKCVVKQIKQNFPPRG